MNEPNMDEEELAMLLDGKLDDRQRAAMLAHLSTADDDYHVFADAAAILRELEEESAAADEPAPGVIDLDSARRGGVLEPAGVDAAPGVLVLNPGRRRGWLLPAGWVAVAALVVGVMVARPQDYGNPVRVAETLGMRKGLPDDWAERPRWSSTRGGDDASANAVMAVRAGALLMDLSVAIRARDSADTHLLATQMRSRFDAGAGEEGSLRRIADEAGASAQSLRPLLNSASERLAEQLGRDPLRVGVWIEAARLAAESKDAEFFRSRGTRAMLDRAAGVTANDAAASAALARVRAAIAGDKPDWNALRPALDALLQEAAT